LVVGSFREHDIEKLGGDACDDKASHESRFGLEQIEPAAAVDHRRLVLVSMKEADHIVIGDGRQQGMFVCFAPPMRPAGSFVVEGAAFRIPIFRGEGIPAVMLEQHDRTTVTGGCRKVLLQPGQTVDCILALVSAETMELDEMQATPIPGIAVGFSVVIACRNRWLEKDTGPVVDLDIVAQLTTIPVDVRRRSVLVEIMIAQTGIDREMHAIVSYALLVAMAELQELGAFAGHGDLAASVIRHVA